MLIPLSTSCEYHPDYYFKTIYEYSGQGNVCKEIRYDFRGVYETMVYVYNPVAQLIMETRLRGGDELDYRITSAYDMKGRLIRQTKKWADGGIAYDQIISHEKNTTGNKIKALYANVYDHKICCTLERHLDEYGNLIRYIARDEYGVFYDDWMYEYDGDGNTVHKTWKTPSEIVEFYMTYDERGHLIRNEFIATIPDKESLYSTVWKYRYVFDDKGRVIKQLVMEDDLFPRVICFTYDSLGRIKEKREYDRYSREIESFTACFQ